SLSLSELAMDATTAQPTQEKRQMLQTPLTTGNGVPARRWNALKHGLRAGAMLLPSDDREAFRALRADYFSYYEPRTVPEARCVEKMVACEWRIQRCQRWQGHFDDHVEREMADGGASQADPHRLGHRGMDCVLQERRLDRLMARAEARLDALQTQRAHQLNPRPEILREPEALMTEWEPPELTAMAPVARAAEAAPKLVEPAAATPAKERPIPIRDEQPSAPIQRFPKHWSRKQREAALRRVARPPGRADHDPQPSAGGYSDKEFPLESVKQTPYDLPTEGDSSEIVEQIR
ncbi:MAG TPA: hypothetical protein VF678_12065, partial [bacterium]